MASYGVFPTRELAGNSKELWASLLVSLIRHALEPVHVAVDAILASPQLSKRSLSSLFTVEKKLSMTALIDTESGIVKHWARMSPT